MKYESLALALCLVWSLNGMTACQPPERKGTVVVPNTSVDQRMRVLLSKQAGAPVDSSFQPPFVAGNVLSSELRANALRYGAVRQVPAGPGLVDLLVDVQ
ncbi:MAG: hypothetical protein AAFQ50_15500, partial [Pseudomonadota bacterium]